MLVMWSVYKRINITREARIFIVLASYDAKLGNNCGALPVVVVVVVVVQKYEYIIYH
jgi:hypothetical protein